MATEDRRETFDIEKTLLSEAPNFSFIQAIRLLRLAADSDNPFEYVRVRPDLAWNTPSQDIISAEKNSSPHSIFRLTVTFLELYGAASPLPMFYTQDLIGEQNKNCSVNREFLDIFNGILYEIYFSIWKKYDLLFQMYESPDIDIWEQLFCIVGLGNSEIRKKLSCAKAQVAFSGFYSRPIRTAEGLRAILSSLLGDIPVAVEQCVSRTASIPDPQRVIVGQRATTLGSDIYIGKQIQDRMGLFRIKIGPLSSDIFDHFLPDTKTMSIINEQIRLYINQPLQWDIEIQCRTKEMTTVCLGEDKKGLLGWNSWIFSGKLSQKHVTARF